MIKEVLREFGLEMGLLFAGLAGALASLTKEKDLSITQRIITVVVGGFVAGYMTPIVGNIISMGDEFKYGVGFVLGYTGLRSVEFVINKYFNNSKETKTKKK